MHLRHVPFPGKFSGLRSRRDQGECGDWCLGSEALADSTAVYSRGCTLTGLRSPGRAPACDAGRACVKTILTSASFCRVQAWHPRPWSASDGGRRGSKCGPRWAASGSSLETFGAPPPDLLNPNLQFNKTPHLLC